MRAFVALRLPDGFEAEVEELARVLAACVEGRFVPRENRHVTLAFLGEIGEREAACAVDVLEEASLSQGAARMEPEGLSMLGGRREGALCLRLRATEGLVGLATQVRSGLARRQVAYDEKPFLPHVTLARRSSMVGIDLGDLPFPGPDEACELVLFRSILSPQGSIYKELHAVELGC